MYSLNKYIPPLWYNKLLFYYRYIYLFIFSFLYFMNTHFSSWLLTHEFFICLCVLYIIIFILSHFSFFLFHFSGGSSVPNETLYWRIQFNERWVVKNQNIYFFIIYVLFYITHISVYIFFFLRKNIYMLWFIFAMYPKWYMYSGVIQLRTKYQSLIKKKKKKRKNFKKNL